MMDFPVSGGAKARINGEQRIPVRAICGAGGDSDGRVGLCPQVGLTLIDSVVVPVELFGVVIFELVGELEEEVDELCGGLVGEVERDVDERQGVAVHEGVSRAWGDLALRRERALERLAACSLASRSR